MKIKDNYTDEKNSTLGIKCKRCGSCVLMTKGSENEFFHNLHTINHKYGGITYNDET